MQSINNTTNHVPCSAAKTKIPLFLLKFLNCFSPSKKLTNQVKTNKSQMLYSLLTKIKNTQPNLKKTLTNKQLNFNCKLLHYKTSNEVKHQTKTAGMIKTWRLILRKSN